MTHLNEEKDKFTITVGDFNTPLLIIDRSKRQKISNNIDDPNNTMNQLAILDFCLMLHATTAEYTFF